MHFFYRGVTLSTVDWNNIWSQWTPSKDAQKIVNQNMISDLITLMEYCHETCKDTVVTPMGRKVKECMTKESVSKWQILETASSQLKVHKQAWESHLNQPENLAVEFPIVMSNAQTAKYFKILIADGKKLLKQPNLVKHVSIDYHEPTNTIKVTYV